MAAVPPVANLLAFLELKRRAIPLKPTPPPFRNHGNHVTSVAQLDEDIDAWGTQLAPELLAEIDRIRWEIRDPAH